MVCSVVRPASAKRRAAAFRNPCVTPLVRETCMPIFSAICPPKPADVNAATGAALLPRAEVDVRHKGCKDGGEWNARMSRPGDQ